MSQLITIAERIKVITNIQKTAHAMQLISMSTLSRVGNKKKALQHYTQQLETLTHELGLHLRPLIADKGSRKVYLIIGSQKGFCGSFNISLFNFIKELQKIEQQPFSCIALGPYAYEFCKEQKMVLLNDKITYSLATITEKTDTVFNALVALRGQYDSIAVVSNYNASIFLQRAHKTILPLTYTLDTTTEQPELSYAIEQPFAEIFDYINRITLKNQLFQLLLESLRAENAARALSMDNSTRNAKKLLDEMRLEYNKLRQAKVTKELTELSSSLLDQR